MSANVQDSAVSAFVKQFQPLVQNGESSLAAEARNKARAALSELDIPTRKVEAWKYTKLLIKGLRLFQKVVLYVEKALDTACTFKASFYWP